MTNYKSLGTKTISVLLSLVFVLSVMFSVPINVSAETKEEYEIDGIIYSDIDDTTVEIVDFNPDVLPENLVVPSTVNGKTVTRLASSGFSGVGCKSIVLPETINEIESYGFAFCDFLESVTIKGNVTAIEKSTFYSCDKLKEVTLPDSIESIGEYAFEECTSLKLNKLPKNLKSIGTRAFMKCSSIELIELPKDLVTIGGTAFGGCKSVEKITINSKLETVGYGGFSSNTALTEVVFEERTTPIVFDGAAFTSCVNLTEFDFTKCKSIGMYSFSGCTGFKNIVIPKDAEIEFGDSVFSGCTNLETIVLPDCVKGIPRESFSGCENLTSVVADNVTGVDYEAFSGCKKLTYMSFVENENLRSISFNAFENCLGLTEISLKNVSYIGSEAFKNCSNLKKVETTQALKTVCGEAFLNCKVLEEITLEGVEEIGDAAFKNCYSLLKADTTKALKHIGDYAFFNCELIEDICLTGVDEIDESAFENCYSLNNVTVSEKLKYIRNSAFYNCLSLEEFFIPDSVQTIEAYSLACFDYEDSVYVYTDFIVRGSAESLADEYAEAYGVKWSLPAPVLTSISNVKAGVKINFKKIQGTSGKYRIYRKTASSSWTKLADVTTTSYTDTTAKSGTKYTYTVKFISSKGNSPYDKTGLSIVRLSTPSVSKTENTTKGIKITWGKVSGAAKYRVYLRDGDDWEVLADTTSTSYTHTGLTSGKTYKYTVKCFDSTGESVSGCITAGWSNKFVASPKIKSISNTSKGAKITWGKVSGAAKYRVFVKSGDSWKKLKDTTSTSYTHTGLTSGKTYTYTVRCISSTGKSYTSSYDTTGTKNTYVKRPSISKITNTVDGPKLSWSKVAGATKYNVYVKSGSSWKLLGCTDSTSFVHETATSGKTYTYTLRCADSEGNNISAYNSTGWQNKYIAAPVITSLENTSKGVKITWDKVSGAAKYRVFVKSGDSWKKLKDTTSTSYTHTGLSSGKTYTYTVRCISSTGKSYTSSYDTVGQAIVFEK